MNKDLLELYTDYLLSAFSYTTATGLSKMTNQEVSHDKVTRFLSEEDLDSRVLWRLVKPLVRELEKEEEEEEEGVLIIDDTIEEKPYTDESELVCWHYDHSEGRNVKGINLLSALYRIGDVSIPVASSWSGRASGSSTKRRVSGKGRAPRPRTSSTARCSVRARRTASRLATC